MDVEVPVAFPVSVAAPMTVKVWVGDDRVTCESWLDDASIRLPLDEGTELWPVCVRYVYLEPEKSDDVGFEIVDNVPE